MRVQPETAEAARRDAGIGHLVEEVRHGGVIEGNRDRRCGLFEDDQVIDVEQIGFAAQAEGTDLRRATVAEVVSMGRERPHFSTFSILAPQMFADVSMGRERPHFSTVISHIVPGGAQRVSMGRERPHFSTLGWTTPAQVWVFQWAANGPTSARKKK